MSERGTGLSGLAHSESSDEIVGRYDAWVGEYETDVRSWGYTLPERLTELLVQASSHGTDPHVLDVGCGTGLIGEALRSAGLTRITGTDISQQSLRAAHGKELYRAVVAADIAAGLPFAAGQFDAVACGGVLTYVPDTEAALREFLRLLAPGGVAIVSQRTDLWLERDCDAVVQRLRSEGRSVEVTKPEPYLPRLDDYGEQIEVVFVTLRST